MNIKTVYVEITNRCNLNCRTCYNRSGLNQKLKELSAEQLESIIKTFAPFGLKRFLLSGGEPTLHTEFNNILNLIDRYPEISFGIVTNGTNHNQKLIDYLNTKPNFKLQISLDGASEAVNAKTRGSGNFAKAVELAKKIRTTPKKPLLKMVISQQNLNDVEGFIDFALGLGFAPELAFIYKSGNGADSFDSKALSAAQKMQVLKLIKRKNSETGADIFVPSCTYTCPLWSSDREHSLCIKVDGSIQPCQSLYGGEFTVGNALQFNRKAFLSNMEKIFNTAKARFNKDFGCQRCIINGYCGKGCMAEAANLCGNPLGDDGACDFRKIQFIEFNIKNEALKNDN